MGKTKHTTPKLDKHAEEKKTDYFTVLLLVVALFTLSFIGAGNLRVVGAAGIMLCLAGMLKEEAYVDLWGLVLLVIYNLMCMLSSWHTYENIVTGFASLHLIFPVAYLLMACLGEEEKKLLHRLCACWAGAVAGLGICQFVWQAMHHEAGRLGGIIGNANALGIFLVIGWFALLTAREDVTEETRFWRKPLYCLEPVILIALSLTLSMGSFCAMAAGIFIMILPKIRQTGLVQGVLYAFGILARATLGFAVGLLMYIAATRTVMPWVCVLLLIYACALSMRWENFICFLNQCKIMPAMLSVMGIVVAGATVAARPSAIATFTERLAMMRNGLGYILEDPLLGVGPYQWRTLNLYDSDTYFNTWHIHNALIHVGVETGLIAMALLIWVIIRFYMKKETPSQRAGFTALVFHNMMDTSFFYPSIVMLTMMTAVNPGERGKRAGGAAIRTFFGICALLFAWNLSYYMLKAGEQS